MYVKFTQAQSGDPIFVDTTTINFFRPSPQDRRNTELRFAGVTVTLAHSLEEVAKKIEDNGYSVEGFDDNPADENPITIGTIIHERSFPSK